MYYNPPRRLTDAEMTVNANYIYSFLNGKGWSKNAIAGILGNMQSESSINPNRWQSDNIGNLSGGYGLVQWTPATNYIDWANSKGYDYTSMDSNLLRIIAEVETDSQWGSNAVVGAPPYNFEGFTHSEESPYILAVNFLWFYERPDSQNHEPQDVNVQQQRGNQASHWFEVLTGESGGNGGHGCTAPHTFNIFNYMGKRRFIIK